MLGQPIDCRPPGGRSQTTSLPAAHFSQTQNDEFKRNQMPTCNGALLFHAAKASSIAAVGRAYLPVILRVVSDRQAFYDAPGLRMFARAGCCVGPRSYNWPASGCE